ncbi:hypothetical protein NOF04DRAFT_22340 [Fusarium oxysporum II5]|uniref:Uncharacterized protein n=2 Tax=Fusarium oxysporum species complex TaxID=171631 RepID=X0JN84_FUSO5|nr:uncharacterized protein FOIG_06881 [Fusarium odoratissimum NRRL 54006]EXM02754.1 hypothetical protein FOIG_06881 [Fusarium odoratissimum NRRL 54006]KAK2133417.1 hypothetical protein NOF04DRAFT_22340 [Fusarium oxysporum II5]
MASRPSPTSERPTYLDVLDNEHRKVLERAVRNLLSTEVAEVIYAQILDGLPTEKSLRDSSDYVKDHPVHSIQHTEICPGYVEKAREFSNQFDLLQLQIKFKTIKAFEDALPGSEQFSLRLIELVAVAFHEIGAHLFDLDDGAHKHKKKKNAWVESQRYYDPPPIAFCHRAYRYPEQYPKGLADVAGYWAESKILGGVVLFDRGETEQDCNAMWIHGDLIRGPRTLYSPTKEQFDALTRFLTNPLEEGLTCPFPIHGASVNRPRWHPYHAFAYYHIFRDRYERKLPPNPPQPGCVEDGMDWPELDDRRILLLGGFSNAQGEPYVNDDEYAAATVRIKNITPSSPLWRPSEI